jgi:hypothetical protein
MPPVVATQEMGLAVAADQGEGDAHLLAVVAADLEAVRAPSPIRAIDCDAAIMPPLLTARGMSVENEAPDIIA